MFGGLSRMPTIIGPADADPAVVVGADPDPPHASSSPPPDPSKDIIRFIHDVAKAHQGENELFVFAQEPRPTFTLPSWGRSKLRHLAETGYPRHLLMKTFMGATLGGICYQEDGEPPPGEVPSTPAPLSRYATLQLLAWGAHAVSPLGWARAITKGTPLLVQPLPRFGTLASFPALQKSLFSSYKYALKDSGKIQTPEIDIDGLRLLIFQILVAVAQCHRRGVALRTISPRSFGIDSVVIGGQERPAGGPPLVDPMNDITWSMPCPAFTLTPTVNLPHPIDLDRVPQRAAVIRSLSSGNVVEMGMGGGIGMDLDEKGPVASRVNGVGPSANKVSSSFHFAGGRGDGDSGGTPDPSRAMPPSRSLSQSQSVDVLSSQKLPPSLPPITRSSSASSLRRKDGRERASSGVLEGSVRGKHRDKANKPKHRHKNKHFDNYSGGGGGGTPLAWKDKQELESDDDEDEVEVEEEEDNDDDNGEEGDNGGSRESKGGESSRRRDGDDDDGTDPRVDGDEDSGGIPRSCSGDDLPKEGEDHESIKTSLRRLLRNETTCVPGVRISLSQSARHVDVHHDPSGRPLTFEQAADLIGVGVAAGTGGGGGTKEDSGLIPPPPEFDSTMSSILLDTWSRASVAKRLHGVRHLPRLRLQVSLRDFQNAACFSPDGSFLFDVNSETKTGWNGNVPLESVSWQDIPYIAPEVFKNFDGRPEIDDLTDEERAIAGDAWSVGILIWTLIRGEPPVWHERFSTSKPSQMWGQMALHCYVVALLGWSDPQGERTNSDMWKALENAIKAAPKAGGGPSALKIMSDINAQVRDAAAVPAELRGLLGGLLNGDPYYRLSVIEALEHEFFAPVWNELEATARSMAATDGRPEAVARAGSNDSVESDTRVDVSSSFLHPARPSPPDEDVWKEDRVGAVVRMVLACGQEETRLSAPVDPVLGAPFGVPFIPPQPTPPPAFPPMSRSQSTAGFPVPPRTTAKVGGPRGGAGGAASSPLPASSAPSRVSSSRVDSRSESPSPPRSPSPVPEDLSSTWSYSKDIFTDPKFLQRSNSTFSIKPGLGFTSSFPSVPAAVSETIPPSAFAKSPRPSSSAASTLARPQTEGAAPHVKQRPHYPAFHPIHAAGHHIHRGPHHSRAASSSRLGKSRSVTGGTGLISSPPPPPSSRLFPGKLPIGVVDLADGSCTLGHILCGRQRENGPAEVIKAQMNAIESYWILHSWMFKSRFSLAELITKLDWNKLMPKVGETRKDCRLIHLAWMAPYLRENDNLRLMEEIRKVYAAIEPIEASSAILDTPLLRAHDGELLPEDDAFDLGSGSVDTLPSLDTLTALQPVPATKSVTGAGIAIVGLPADAGGSGGAAGDGGSGKGGHPPPSLPSALSKGDAKPRLGRSVSFNVGPEMPRLQRGVRFDKARSLESMTFSDFAATLHTASEPYTMLFLAGHGTLERPVKFQPEICDDWSSEKAEYDFEDMVSLFRDLHTNGRAPRLLYFATCYSAVHAAALAEAAPGMCVIGWSSEVEDPLAIGFSECLVRVLGEKIRDAVLSGSLKVDAASPGGGGEAGSLPTQMVDYTQVCTPDSLAEIFDTVVQKMRDERRLGRPIILADREPFTRLGMMSSVPGHEYMPLVPPQVARQEGSPGSGPCVAKASGCPVFVVHGTRKEVMHEPHVTDVLDVIGLRQTATAALSQLESRSETSPPPEDPRLKRWADLPVEEREVWKASMGVKMDQIVPAAPPGVTGRDLPPVMAFRVAVREREDAPRYFTFTRIGLDPLYMSSGTGQALEAIRIALIVHKGMPFFFPSYVRFTIEGTVHQTYKYEFIKKVDPCQCPCTCGKGKRGVASGGATPPAPR